MRGVRRALYWIAVLAAALALLIALVLWLDSRDAADLRGERDGGYVSAAAASLAKTTIR